MTGFLFRLARWCAGHAWWVIAAWLVALVVIGGANNRLPPPGQQDFSLGGTDSAAALTLMQQAFPGTASDANPLVVGGDDVLNSGPGLETIENVEEEVKKINGVSKVDGPQDNPDQCSADKKTAQIQVTVTDRFAGQPEIAQEILDAGQAAAPNNQVALGGLLGESISQPSSQMSEVIGLIAAVIVLLISLRRGWAAAVPLINAILTVGIGLAVVGLLGRVVLIPSVAPTLGTMLGLGVGIDYALFLMVRHRQMLARGFEVKDSTARTAGTSGAGIIFAGTTLILALCGLVLTGISFLMWMGFAAAIVVEIAIVASATLVPAILSLLGNKVVPKKHHDLVHDGDEHLDRGLWARIADAVTKKPWTFTIVSLTILLILAAPMLSMSFGMTDDSDLDPSTTAYQANEMMVDAFGPGSTGPFLVVNDMLRPATAPKDPTSGGDPRAQDPRLTHLVDTMEGTEGVTDVSQPFVDASGGVAAFSVTPTTGPADPATEVLINDLRNNVLPPATAGEEMVPHAGGSTALMMDLTTVIGERLPYFIFGVALLSGLLLMVAYRSLWIPIKAAAMTLISICAAYGVVVAVFEWGWGRELIGLDHEVAIQTFIPMMMYAILFGLSMDYEVFLLTGFREHWERSGDMVVAVRRGLTDTGQVVTSAATIMMVVFASFILVPDATVKMFGVGLATSVFVDATIVRCLLVPALMVLAKKWTWWLPGLLDRSLPHLEVEGDPTSLDAAADKPPEYRPVSVAEATKPAVGTIAVVVGAGIAWFGGSRINADSLVMPFQDVAILTSAILGAMIVWIPRGMPGAGSKPGLRILLFLVGAFAVAIVFMLLRSLIPHTASIPGQLSAWALLIVTVVVVVIPPLRRYGLALIHGGVIMAVTFGVGAADINADFGVLLRNALLPAFVAGFIALFVSRLMGRTQDPDPPVPPGGPVQPPTMDQPETAGPRAE